MTAYYVLGVTFVLFALGLTALGLTRDNFPPTPRGGRVLMGIGGLIAVVTFVVLVSSTHVEHPREEAAAKEAEKKAEEAPGGEGAAGAAGAVAVVEKEYSIRLPGGNRLPSGKLTFEVANEGKIEHDLAIEGAPNEPKTPLIDAGKRAKLEASLDAGKYTLICTVPGHEQLGMKDEIEVSN